MTTNRIAVLIVGYNRPYYFLPSLRSILSNPLVSQCDLWVFLDGGDGNEQTLQVKIAREELRRSIHIPKRVEFVLRTANLGCGRNLIDARRRLFDDEQYDLVFVFEDDLVVAPAYLQLCLNLLHWSLANYGDVGVVQAYNACWLSAEQKVGLLDEVTASNPHWWGYLMPRRTWEAIRDTLYCYEVQFLRGRRYRDRDTPAIRCWASSQVADLVADRKGEPLSTANSFPGKWNLRHSVGREFPSGQDGVTALAVALQSMTKIVTTVNRGLPIGRRGIHFNEASFKRHRLDRIKLDLFESDHDRSTFRPKDSNQKILQPFMRADEVEAIRAVMRDRSPQRVLEFGAGGSTIVLSREPSVQQWWTIEHNDVWLRRVMTRRSPADEQRLTLLSCSEAEILSRLDRLLREAKFDMFFVDGFDRAKILARLHEHLQTESGFVVLHDYARHAYSHAIGRYAKRTELSTPQKDKQGLLLLEA